MGTCGTKSMYKMLIIELIYGYTQKDKVLMAEKWKQKMF